MRTRFIHRCCAVWIVICSVTTGLAPSLMAATQLNGIDVFAQLTQHIRRQADTDKQAFAVASQCMNWFYKQQRHKPAPPAVQNIAWNRDRHSPWNATEAAATGRSRLPRALSGWNRCGSHRFSTYPSASLPQPDLL